MIYIGLSVVAFRNVNIHVLVNENKNGSCDPDYAPFGDHMRASWQLPRFQSVYKI